MPGFQERLFRIAFFCVAGYCLFLGLHDLTEASAVCLKYWYAPEKVDRFFLLFALIVFYGARPIFGVVLLKRFRELAAWAVRQIPESNEKKPQHWYDPGPMCVLLCVLFGAWQVVVGWWILQQSCWPICEFWIKTEFNFRTIFDVIKEISLVLLFAKALLPIVFGTLFITHCSWIARRLTPAVQQVVAALPVRKSGIAHFAETPEEKAVRNDARGWFLYGKFLRLLLFYGAVLMLLYGLRDLAGSSIWYPFLYDLNLIDRWEKNHYHRCVAALFYLICSLRLITGVALLIFGNRIQRSVMERLEKTRPTIDVALSEKLGVPVVPKIKWNDTLPLVNLLCLAIGIYFIGCGLANVPKFLLDIMLTVSYSENHFAETARFLFYSFPFSFLYIVIGVLLFSGSLFIAKRCVSWIDSPLDDSVEKEPLHEESAELADEKQREKMPLRFILYRKLLRNRRFHRSRVRRKKRTEKIPSCFSGEQKGRLHLLGSVFVFFMAFALMLRGLQCGIIFLTNYFAALESKKGALLSLFLSELCVIAIIIAGGILLRFRRPISRELCEMTDLGQKRFSYFHASVIRFYGFWLLVCVLGTIFTNAGNMLRMSLTEFVFESVKEQWMTLAGYSVLISLPGAFLLCFAPQIAQAVEKMLFSTQDNAPQSEREA